MFAHFQNEKWKQIWKHKFINITITWKVHWIESSQLTVQIIIAVIEVTSLVLTWGITATLLSGEPKRKVINHYYVSSIKHQIITKNTKKCQKLRMSNSALPTGNFLRILGSAVVFERTFHIFWCHCRWLTDERTS